jgi:hypothetical protein
MKKNVAQKNLDRRDVARGKTLREKRRRANKKKRF